MKKGLQTGVFVLLAGAAVVLAFFTGDYVQSVARNILIYMALALSWDMLVRSGQISFGIAGFVGLGAYTSIISVLKLGMSPIVSILAGGLFAALVALLLGLVVLRLRAMYFAITTLALAQIFQIIVQNWNSLTGGPEGMILPGIIFGSNSHYQYWLCLAMVFIVVVSSEIFQNSKMRFALTAIRNDEIIAKSSGIYIFKYLLITFVVTSALQGMVGGINAQLYAYVTPDSSFSTDFTLLPLAMALLGGIYKTGGPVIGALILGIIAENLKHRIPYGHLVVYGIIIIIVILFMPRGMIGLARSGNAKVKAEGKTA